MTQQYRCSSCGVITTDKYHLCQPVEQAEGAHCGDTSTAASANMCDAIEQQTTYTCSGCGRISDDPEALCSPRERG